MADFVYLFWNQREDAQRMAQATAEQRQAITGRWKAWLADLAKKGHVKDIGGRWNSAEKRSRAPRSK